MSVHHPDEITLLDYAAGSFSIPQALAVSVHLYFCNACRHQVKQLNNIGGVLLENTAPASVDDNAFDTLMSQLDSEPMELATRTKPQRKVQTVIRELPVATSRSSENPLLRYLPASLQNLPWLRQTREISKYELSSRIDFAGFKVALQKIAAGAKVPSHTHKGSEITVILSGGYSDELGVYHAGDFIARDARHVHSPVALKNEDCICLTVLDAPLAFTGWQRILNPFMAW